MSQSTTVEFVTVLEEYRATCYKLWQYMILMIEHDSIVCVWELWRMARTLLAPPPPPPPPPPPLPPPKVPTQLFLELSQNRSVKHA